MGEFSPYFFTALAMFRAPFFLSSRVPLCKVHPAAHEGVGQVRALEDGGRAEGLVHLDDGLGLGHGVDVERALGVVVLLGGLHQGSQRY